MKREGYRLEIYFSDGSVEQVDEWFDSEAEAYEEYESWLENFSVGEEILRELDDEDYTSATITGYNIYEDYDEIVD